MINLDYKQSERAHLVSLFIGKNTAVFFDCFGIEYTFRIYLELKIINLLCVDFIVPLS